MTKLTQKEKDNFPSHYFAVPGKKKLPINDQNHVDMAWRMINKTDDLTDEERSFAKNRILRRAHQLGINTDTWHARAEPEMVSDEFFGMRDTALSAIDLDELEAGKQLTTFQGMAVAVPDFPDHPNKTPFTGVLTILNQISDAPLGGSDGKKVVLPTDVAEKALASLLQMSVDFQPDFDGHDPTRKIGLIEEAYINENKIHVSGFLYTLDFPEEVKRIQRDKEWLGMSFEAQVLTRALDDGNLLITYCAFTGAAILFKDKAAFIATSLSASAEQDTEMSKEILEAIAALGTRYDGLEKQFKEVKELHASSSMPMMDKVKPHADALHAAADAMCAAGIGADQNNGHAAMVHRVANHMMAAAAMNALPHIYRDNDFTNGLSANADNTKSTAVSAAADKAAENTALNAVLEEVKSLKTKIEDSEKARFHAAGATPRQTVELSPLLKTMMAQGELGTEKDEKLAIATVDKAMKAAGVSAKDSIAAKLQLRANGALKGQQ